MNLYKTNSQNFVDQLLAGKTDKTSAELLLDTAMFTELYGHPVVITSVKISSNQQHMAFIVETSSMDTYDAHILQIGKGASKYIERIQDVFSIGENLTDV